MSAGPDAKRRRVGDAGAADHRHGDSTCYPTMTNCLAAWLELAAGSAPATAQRPVSEAGCPRADEVMMARLQINLQKSFDPELADREFATGRDGEAPSGPPAWLCGIIRSEQGRKLLATLASQHPECRLLSFATAASSDTAAAASSASAAGVVETEELETFLGRFGDCVAGVLDAVTAAQRSPTAGDNGAHAALCKLCELCSATDFAFVYGLYLLHAVDTRGSAQSGEVATGARRLAQDVYRWAGTAGVSPSARRDLAAANRAGAENTAAPGQQLLVCGRGTLHGGRRHGVSAPLASMEASGMASVGDAERLHSSLTREGTAGAQQALQGLRSRAFLLAMLAALFNPVRPPTCPSCCA